MSKELFGLISLFFTGASLVPYMWTLHTGKTKPHMFSWIIWTLLSSIVSAGQFAGGAGAGAWAAGFTALCSVLIVFQSLKHGEKNITRSDWIFFIAALSGIPLWMITSDPLYSIILVTVINVAAYGPTVRKSWDKPYQENALSYGMASFKHIATLFAIEKMSVLNCLFPVMMVFINGGVTLFLMIRRWQLRERPLP